MNKEKLAEVVMNKISLTKTDTLKAIESIFDTIVETLTKNDEVSITGFGSFSVNKRAARTGVNPRTGEKIQIDAKSVPKFKAGKSLKDAVKGCK
ncbi:MAG: HU family DNA-binding protein [Candidatus Staskawiczbacteria bacterium]|nr:HU family DNA-binding protein [Candidatus Staskawiczbacteria bacterium]